MTLPREGLKTGLPVLLDGFTHFPLMYRGQTSLLETLMVFVENRRGLNRLNAAL